MTNRKHALINFGLVLVAIFLMPIIVSGIIAVVHSLNFQPDSMEEYSIDPDDPNITTSLALLRYRSTQQHLQTISSFKNLDTLVVMDYDLNRNTFPSDEFAKLNKLREVRLSGTKADETVVEALSKCPELKELSITNNGISLTSEMMRSLSALKLTLLDIGYNSFDAKSLSYFSNFSNLQSLNISSTPTLLKDLQPLLQIKSLQKLYFWKASSYSQAIGPSKDDLHTLSQFTQLNELDLSYFPQAESLIPAIRHLQKLHTLSLRNNQITEASINQLFSLKNLTTLRLNSSKITDSGSTALPNHKLRILDLSEISISNDGLRRILACPNLESLSLTQFDPANRSFTSIAPIELLKNLKHLNLHGVKIKSGLTVLKTLEHLEDLNLSTCNLHDQDLEFIRDHYNLKTLDLSINPITAEGLNQLQSLQELETLNISHNNLANSNLFFASEMTRLKDLNLANTKVTDTICPVLRTLTNLERLDLSGTRITSNCFQSLQQMAKLKSLSLSETAITNDHISALGNLRQLESLFLNRTRITADGIRQLSQLKSLRYLDLGYTQIGRKQAEELHRLFPECHIRGGAPSSD